MIMAWSFPLWKHKLQYSASFPKVVSSCDWRIMEKCSWNQSPNFCLRQELPCLSYLGEMAIRNEDESQPGDDLAEVNNVGVHGEYTVSWLTVSPDAK
ncbi:hypothetical protein Y1Q_0022236 [Alligator mississippiensis]|uniref:Uncharacterized protein n=1 Tax=Alligator mississippiensis TaxID=8496 RepID=A0A151NZR6_ALLMI|nr:hypothetical protein Y1Q_0022236 [Alligator mississippiensis]